MTKKYDAIIIGAGVIGAPIAFELAKMGYKTLSVDKLADAGEGERDSALFRTGPGNCGGRGRPVEPCDWKARSECSACGETDWLGHRYSDAG